MMMIGRGRRKRGKESERGRRRRRVREGGGEGREEEKSFGLGIRCFRIRLYSVISVSSWANGFWALLFISVNGGREGLK